MSAMNDTDLVDIFQLALDDSDTLGTVASGAVTATIPPRHERIAMASQSRAQHHGMIPTPQLAQPWVPPFEGWQWGMPLPPGYPPPPLPPTQVHHKNAGIPSQQAQHKKGAKPLKFTHKDQEGHHTKTAITQSPCIETQRNTADPWAAQTEKAAAKKSILDIQKEQELEPKGKRQGGIHVKDARPMTVNNIKSKKNISDKSMSHNDPNPRGCFWHLAGKFPRIDFSPECMDYSEINLIMKMQFFPLRTNDVRRDDYYFDEAMARHRARLVSGMQPQPLGT